MVEAVRLPVEVRDALLYYSSFFEPPPPMTTSSLQGPSDHPTASAAQSALRIFAAGVFIQHGAQKLLGVFADPGMAHGPSGHLPPLLLTAGVIELVGGSFILIGLFSRAVAFIAAGEMAVAYFKVHFPRGFWPIENHGEVPVLLCFIFLFIAAAGPGSFSIDTLLAKWRGEIT
jgi:putative oxidoreductase